MEGEHGASGAAGAPDAAAAPAEAPFHLALSAEAGIEVSGHLPDQESADAFLRALDALRPRLRRADGGADFDPFRGRDRAPLPASDGEACRITYVAGRDVELGGRIRDQESAEDAILAVQALQSLLRRSSALAREAPIAAPLFVCGNSFLPEDDQ
jgi:hypothetical protein